MPTWSAITPTSRTDGTAATAAEAWDAVHNAAVALVRAGAACPIVLDVDGRESTILGPAGASGEQLVAFIESGRDDIVAAYR